MMILVPFIIKNSVFTVNPWRSISPKIWHRKLSYGIFCKIVLMPSKVSGGRSLDLTVHTGAKDSNVGRKSPDKIFSFALVCI